MSGFPDPSSESSLTVVTVLAPSTGVTHSKEPFPGEREGGTALTDVERAVLDFAALRWKYQGAKETAVRDTFGWSLTRYLQVLNALLDRPAAHAYAPVVVARLVRLREARHRERRPSEQ